MSIILANDGIDSTGKSLLEKAGFTVITEKVEQEKLTAAINEKNISGIIVRSATKVRKEVIDACTQLKLVARGGVGMDNIDVEYAKSKGLHVVNTPAASSNAVAELVFAHLLGLVRFLHEANRKMPISGATQFATLKKNYSEGIELRGKTIGIIGFGRIGQAVAKIALGCGMKVVAHNNTPCETILNIEINDQKIPVSIKTVSLNELLSTADFVTLHVPGGEVITKKEFSLMKQGAVIINTSRGGVINETDLLEALNSGKIAAAGLDVFNNEPTPNSELLNHPKISLTPHTGAATKEAQERIGIELAERIISLLK